MASWLDARAHAGTWLVRMEDLDPARSLPDAADAILRTLARFGMESDAPVLWQSTRREAYRDALDKLIDRGLAYRCRCSREERASAAPCRCRELDVRAPDAAWRLHIESAVIAFEDGIQGSCRYPAVELGDPILHRRDGVAAYQLAVAVDDAFQGITDVVRGADLLESTAWQVAVYEALALPVPRFAHIPLLTEPDGNKLAKSRRSLPLDALDAPAAMAEALTLLNIPLPEELKAARVSDMLHWSVPHWNPVRMAGVQAIALPH